MKRHRTGMTRGQSCAGFGQTWAWAISRTGKTVFPAEKDVPYRDDRLFTNKAAAEDGAELLRNWRR